MWDNRGITQPPASEYEGMWDNRGITQPPASEYEGMWDNRGTTEAIGGAEREDLKGIEGQQAKLKGLALFQMRTLEKKQGMSELGGPPFTPKDQKILDKLREMDKEEKVYSKLILTAAHGGLI